ncbi:WecB/TagA/CpsF family glycosyltransferase [Ignavibacteria bacterium 4148-Me]|uniref:WecB/TagA/CpsF family glycosyltransferase n=1 Tax=Rosettibacter primus TaxID=3111523 RepID=UPI00336BE4F1
MELFNKIISSKKELINFTLNKLLNSKGILFTYFDFHAFNHVKNNKKYCSLMIDNFYIFQDGIGMYLALNYLRKDADRLVSTDYFNWLIKKITKTKKKIFLLGYDFKNEFVESKSKEKNLYLIGYHHGFFNSCCQETIINSIKDSNAEFVFIGMGKPKQEFIAAELKKHLPEINYVCVGNFFNYYFDIKKRAPSLIQHLQLEWLYRVVKEPRRLFFRYFLGIPLFIYYMLTYQRAKFNRGLNYEDT